MRLLTTIRSYIRYVHSLLALSVFRSEAKKNVSNGCGLENNVMSGTQGERAPSNVLCRFNVRESGCEKLPCSRGFILVLTVGMIAIMSIIVVRMLTDLMSFQQLESVLLAREQAKQCAWSGIQIAIAQILEKAPKSDEKLPEADAKFKKQLFELRKIMTITNRWQNISYDATRDGIGGACTVYIACENGKLNPFVLAGIIKSEPPVSEEQMQQTGVGATKPIGNVIRSALQKYFNNKGLTINILERLAALLEKRNHETWDDVSELLEDEQLKGLGDMLFLAPDRDWALTDFFSLQHSSKVLQSWALSRSVTALADLVPTGTPTDEDMKKIGDTIEQKRQAKETWDLVLKTIYNKQMSEEWYNLLNTRFEADIFSVISYGTYRNIVVKLYAIVQRRREKKQDGTERDACVVKKIYWIYE